MLLLEKKKQLFQFIFTMGGVCVDGFPSVSQEVWTQ